MASVKSALCKTPAPQSYLSHREGNHTSSPVLTRPQVAQITQDTHTPQSHQCDQLQVPERLTINVQIK